MRTFSKFLVLLWKNLLLKRRHWFMTILEIAVPVLLFVILAVIRGEVDPPVFKEIITNNLETYQVMLRNSMKSTIFTKKITPGQRLGVKSVHGSSFTRRWNRAGVRQPLPLWTTPLKYSGNTKSQFSRIQFYSPLRSST